MAAPHAGRRPPYSRPALLAFSLTVAPALVVPHHTGRFPRSHRFVLGERIERNLYDLLETLVKPRYRRERQALLGQANLTLEVLRFQMRQGLAVSEGQELRPCREDH
jgi:hypothetical protein